MRRRIHCLFRCSAIICTLALFSLALPLSVRAYPVPPEHHASYSVIGAPTVSAAFIDQVLSAYHSPATGKGQVLYNEGIKYGIDPAFALAFFMHESSFGTAGVAQYTLSLGNLRCISNAACQNGYAAFPSWDAGIDAWYSLIRNLYINTWGLTTVEEIIPRYAPSSDNNNDAAYINGVESAIDAWRGQQTTVPLAPGNGQIPATTPPLTNESGTNQTPAITYPADGYTITGKPTVSAAYIDTILTRYHSPAAGKGQALYDAGVKANIDPVYALAFFMHDSIFGTVGMAKVTLAIGNIPSPVTTACHCQDFHGYRRYSNWEDSFNDWYQFIHDHYVKQGVTTIGQIIPAYSATNDPSVIKSFIKAIESRVDLWRNDYKQSGL